jgi:hypothetical protein
LPNAVYFVVREFTPQGVRHMSKGFVRYETKNGVEYASIYKARRVDGKKINDVEYLGRVIDKEKGVFRSRTRGTFVFSIDGGMVGIEQTKTEKLILDFGDSYILGEMLAKNSFLPLIKRVFGNNSDTIASLLFYKSLSGGANCYADTWYEGSYARIMFPAAKLQSQRVSETLLAIGDERICRTFFSEYLQFISSRCNESILIDSTGLPNDIRMPVTAINNHNGVISNESRLIYIVERDSKLPIYFRYAAGNIVDVSTLKTTIAEVKAFGINVRQAIVDAGYYSDKNIKALQREKIAFVLRVPPNRKLYKELTAEHAPTLEDTKYLVKYRDRFVYIKRVGVDFFGTPGFAYIAVDIDRKHDESKNYLHKNYDNDELTSQEMNDALMSKGRFVLVAAEPIEPIDILPLYYQRQTIEQTFDISKNNADLLPLRVHGINTFRGHLLLSFMATVAYILVNQVLESSDWCAAGAYRILRNQKCKVFDDSIIPQEATKKMNFIAKHVGIEFPTAIQHKAVW